MDSALRCLEKYRIEKSTISDIASEAGVTRATVYSYFPTKQEILHAAFFQVVDQFLGKLLRHLEAFEQPEERLIEALVFICEEMPKDPYLSLIVEPGMSELVNERTLTSQDVKAVRLEMMKTILRGEARYLSNLEDLSEIVSRLVVSFLVMKSERKRSREELGRFFRRFILPVLRSM